MCRRLVRGRSAPAQISIRTITGLLGMDVLASHAGGGAISCRKFEGLAGTLVRLTNRGSYVSKSVLDAIREGDWFFEPEELDAGHFNATSAIPGTPQKLEVLAARARAGLPLWHEKDRTDYEQPDMD